MLLSLGSAVLILLITASLALRKGLYRTTILFFCSLIGAVAAFGYYEVVLERLNQEFLMQFGEGLTLFLLFLMVTLALDLLSERFLTGDLRLPVMVDRIGAGFVGFWTAMLIVGVMCVSIQMLPWNVSVLGFERLGINQSTRKPQSRSLLLKPDEFTVWMVGFLTGHALGGEEGLRSVHPDLLDELAHSNMRVQAESRRVVPPTTEGGPTFDVTGLAEMQEPKLGMVRPKKVKEGTIEIEIMPGDREPAEGNRFLVARCKLSRGGADPEDSYHRFNSNQVRMVGTVNGRPEDFYPMGYRDPAKMEQLGSIRSDQPILFSARSDTQFNLIFEVPQDFVPSFIEYKRLARAKPPMAEKIPVVATADIIKELKVLAPPTATGAPAAGGIDLSKLRERFGGGKQGKPGAQPPAKPPQPKPPAKPPANAPVKQKPPGKPVGVTRGRVGGRALEDAIFSDQLPFALTRTTLAGQQAEVSGDALKAGHIYVPAASESGSPANLVTRFVVPPRMKLLQLECGALHARSTLGRAKEFAVKTVAQYVVIDSVGRNYFPVGEYRIAPIGGKEMMELQYDAEGLPGRSFGPADHIREPQLVEGKSSVTLLYHIPPGTKLVRFSAGPHALSNTDMNLTAPQ